MADAAPSNYGTDSAPHMKRKRKGVQEAARELAALTGLKHQYMDYLTKMAYCAFVSWMIYDT